MSLSEPRFSHEQWVEYQRQFVDWLAQADAQDQAWRQRALNNPESRASLENSFVLHPEYRGKKMFDVLLLMRREARNAIATARLLHEKPDPLTPEESKALKRLHAIWSQFGGAAWVQVPFDQLAQSRFTVAIEGERASITVSRTTDYEEPMNNIVKGFGCLLLGGLITGITYLSASGGGTYYVMWGAMAWGGIMIILGLIRLVLIRLGSR